jgi:hypothetical protein
MYVPFSVFCVFVCVCVCVYVYCTTATGCQPKLQLNVYISNHIIARQSSSGIQLPIMWVVLNLKSKLIF